MNLDIPGESVLGVPILWRDSLKVNVDEVEFDDLLEDVKIGGHSPRIVCILSVNEDGTLTVMGTYFHDVRTVKVMDLRQVNFHCVPSWEERNIDIIWRGWDDRPRCADEYSLFS